MSRLEDAWQKILSSDEYSKGDDSFKERVRSRFFERTVGMRKEYKSLAADKQQAVQQRFYERLSPAKSTTQKVVEGAETVATHLPGVIAAREVGKAGHKFDEGMRGTDESAVKSGSKLQMAGRATAAAFDDLTPDVEKDAAKPGLINKAKQIGKIAVGGTVQTGKQLVEDMIPESTAGTIATIAAGPAIEEGKLAATKLPVIGKILGADVGVYGESIIQKLRGLHKTPVEGQSTALTVPLKNPLQSMIEEEMAYERVLKEKAGLGNGPDPDPYTPEVKVNLSQLRDVHSDRLAKLQAEPEHLQDLAYTEKLLNMPRPQRKVHTPSLVPIEGMEKPGSAAALMLRKELPGQQLAEGPEAFEKNVKKAPQQKGESVKVVDLNAKKLGPSRNLQDIKKKPLRSILKEINDDVGSVGAIRFLGYGQTIGQNDPITLESAKDLRAAIKMPSGRVIKEKFGASAHSYLPLEGGQGATNGFWDNLTKKFISREEAAGYLGWPEETVRRTGGLTAQNLRDLHTAFEQGTGANPDLFESAKNLRVAIKTPEGKIHVGDFGGTHGESFKGKIPEDVVKKSEFGFFNNVTKEFLTREESAFYLDKPENKDFLAENKLSELHKSYTTYVGKREEGLHSLTLDKMKENISKGIIKKIANERGHVVLGDADPARWDRLHQNTRELVRRAVSLGYDSIEDIVGFAARHGMPKEELHFLQAELGGVQPGPFDSQGLKDVLKAKEGNNDMRDTLWEKVKDRWTPDGKASHVRTLLTKHYGEIAEGHLDSQYFIHNTTKQLTKTEREALTFLREGVAPNAQSFRWPDADKILNLVKKPTPAMKEANRKIGAYLEEAHAFLAENFHDAGYVKDYISHLWDKANSLILNPKSRELGTFNPFLQSRSWPSYAHGIEQGGTPKTLDIREIIGAYDRYKIKTVANLRFVEELSKMPTAEGLPAVMDAKAAPLGWVRAENVPALAGKKFHPDYLQAVKTITDAPFSNTALRAYDTLAESQRSFGLMFSPFHFGSLFLTSSFSSDVPFKIPMKVMAMTGKYVVKEALADESEASFFTKLYKAYQNGNAAFANMPMARRATRAGLNLGSIGAEHVTKLEDAILSINGNLRKFYEGKGIKPIRDAYGIWDKTLWSYLHSGIKLMTFQEHLIDNMKKFPEMPVKELEQKTARFVNDLDGGEAWQTMFVSPQYQRALHRAFFFPDWMVSRLRTAFTAFKPAGLNSLANLTKQTPEGYQAQKFWLRAGVAYYSFANWRNYVNTKRDLGEGRFMWDNDPGKKLDVYKGKDEKTGRNIYMNYAPAIVEVFKWFQDPVKSLGARFNPNLQLMTEFFTGSTLSGYKLPEDKRSFASIIKRHYAPIMAQGGNDFGLFPASKGMSSFEVIRRFEGVIKDGDDPSTAIQYGVENGYDVEKLYNIALRNVKGGMKREALSQ